MSLLRRFYLPTVSLIVVCMAIGSAVSGNALDATLFLFAVGIVGLVVAYREHLKRR